LLSISNGNSVDISTVNTDGQKLSTSNDTIYLTNGGYVYIGNGTSGAAQIYIKPEGLSNAFPNPTSGNIKVKYQLPENENSGKFELIDSKGKTIDESMVYSNYGEIDLSISSFSTGQYYIRLQTDSGFSSVKQALVIK
jgi:hypothetical protein